MSMKKFYFIVLCGLLCLPAAADGSRFKSRKLKKNVNRFRVEAAAPIWRPVSQTDFMFTGEDWEEMGTVSFKYDTRGNNIEELVDEWGYYYKTVSTYDDFNQPLSKLVTESEDGVSWLNNSKREYVYDVNVHDFYTSRMGYYWEDVWVADYSCETNDITRNAAGNITEIVKSLPLRDAMEPAYRSVWSYDESTGKANEYAYYTASGDPSDPWTLDEDLNFVDIEWEKTDGQMTVFGDLMELTQGNNLIKKAKVLYVGEPDGYYIVEYKDAPFGYLIKETTNDVNEVGCTTLLETLDDNGSMRLTYTEYFDDEGNIGTDPVYMEVQEAQMDDHGNMVFFTDFETFEGETMQLDGQKVDYTYDVNGNPTEVVTSWYDYETDDYTPMERTVYGEYIDVTSGVRSVNADAAVWSLKGRQASVQAEGMTGVSVYDMRGIKVISVESKGSASINLNTLPAGLYIIHADGTSETRTISIR